MPRAKAAPKRARSPEPEEPVSAAALEAAVESAEVAGVLERLPPGGRCTEVTAASTGPTGLVPAFDLPSPDAEAFCELHELIKARTQLTGWAGAADLSGRLRGYGYFEGKDLSEKHFCTSMSMKEYDGAAAAADRAANRRASILLRADELPAGFDGALGRLCECLRSALLREASEGDAAAAAAGGLHRYAEELTASRLVAAQPNLHAGRRYLRPHLDEPLHDGFGVVIVTVGVRGSGRILLSAWPWDAERREERWFALARGQCYALSGVARNECLHGVMADEGGEERESLNLRFGLHGCAAHPEGPSAHEEVERHWPS